MLQVLHSCTKPAMINWFPFPAEVFVIFPCRCHSCSHFHSVSSHQMAGELEGEKEARELVLGALHHSMQFTLLLSQGLNPAMWPLTSEVPWRTPHIQQQILWRSPQTRYETQKVRITGSGYTMRCCYITLNILQTCCNRLPIAHLWESIGTLLASS